MEPSEYCQMMLQSRNSGCRQWLIQNNVVKDLRRLLAVIFQLMLVICLSGCERKTTEYQESMGIETYAASDQDHKDDQNAFAKGYNLPILQGDIDQAKKETEELLDCIESMYRPYLDDETLIPEDVQEK